MSTSDCGGALESAAGALIATAEHSILGARWIYDAPADRSGPASCFA